MLKNTALLSGMWGLGLGAAFVQIPAAQNVLLEHGHTSISSAPLGLILLLSAPCAVVIPKLTRWCGEKRTFVAASALGVAGALLQMAGVLASHDHGSTSMLILMLVGASFQSFTYAASNNLRFAVACFSTPEYLPKATALVLFGGVLASLFGPLLSNATRHMIPGADYAGNFVQIAIMYCLFGALASLTDFQQPISEQDRDDPLQETLCMVLIDDDDNVEDEDIPPERTLIEILKQTDLALLTLSQCLSYNIMALFMTQVQLPMASLGYSANSRTYAITAHMIGMFLPGLVSGHIITRLGTWPTTMLGFIIFLLGGGLMLVNESLAMFIVGMTLVGVAWNLSFTGQSSEVSKICTHAEKSKVVGFHDGIMLLTIGIFALLGSVIYEAIGSWARFVYTLMGLSGLSALIASWRWCSSRTKSCEGDRSYHHLVHSDSWFDQLITDTL